MNAILSIYGAICGDIIGSRFEKSGKILLDLKDYPLIAERSHPTDDTVFTIGIAECLLRKDLQSRRIAHYLRKWGRRYPHAGFGRATKKWIHCDDPKPYGSDRNGAAMRVSPCGAVAMSLEEAEELARLTAEISHNTKDGINGAQAIAASIFLALHGSTKEEIKAYVSQKFNYDLDNSIEMLKANWSGFSCKAIDTVPQSIVAFLESTDVESAIRNAISLGSDADTMADMAGAIAAAYYGEIPFLDDIVKILPKRMNRILEELNKMLNGEEYNAFIDRENASII